MFSAAPAPLAPGPLLAHALRAPFSADAAGHAAGLCIARGLASWAGVNFCNARASFARSAAGHCIARASPGSRLRALGLAAGLYFARAACLPETWHLCIARAFPGGRLRALPEKGRALGPATPYTRPSMQTPLSSTHTRRASLARQSSRQQGAHIHRDSKTGARYTQESERRSEWERPTSRQAWHTRGLGNSVPSSLLRTGSF